MSTLPLNSRRQNTKIIFKYIYIYIYRIYILSVSRDTTEIFALSWNKWSPARYKKEDSFLASKDLNFYLPEVYCRVSGSWRRLPTFPHCSSYTSEVKWRRRPETSNNNQSSGDVDQRRLPHLFCLRTEAETERLNLPSFCVTAAPMPLPLPPPPPPAALGRPLLWMLLLLPTTWLSNAGICNTEFY